MTIEKSNSKHIPVLDGVRGLAILAVLLCHLAHFVWFDGVDSSLLLGLFGWGWAGVDLFFVLSGFLITGILVDNKGSISYFQTFYWRRTLRIFPLYFGLLIIAWFLFPLFGIRTEVFTGSKNATPYFFSYLYNIYLFLFIQGNPGALGPAWSLCIEEQFYFIWPVMVSILSRRALFKTCIGMFMLSFVTRLLFLSLGYTSDQSYYFTITRLDGLAVGAAIALLVRRPHWAMDWKTKYSVVTKWCFACLIIAVAGVFLKNGYGWEPPMTNLFIFSILSLLSGSLLLLLLNPEETPSLLQKFFSSKILRFLGKYSYGIYILHLAVIFIFDPYLNAIGIRLFSRHSLPLAFFKFFGDMALVLATSFISYHLYEVHFLRLKNILVYPRHLLGAKS